MTRLRAYGEMLDDSDIGTNAQRQNVNVDMPEVEFLYSEIRRSRCKSADRLHALKTICDWHNLARKNSTDYILRV